MNILFLIPPADLIKPDTVVDRVYGCNYGYDYKPAIHLLSSATVLENNRWKVRFMDCPAEGIKANKFKKALENEKFDAVIFFTTWLSINLDLQSAKTIAEKHKGLKIIFTGTYPTWKPELFLINSDYFVVRGEPEETLVELMRFLEYSNINLKEINGLSFIENGKITHNSYRKPLDIDTLPVPNRRLLIGKYFFNRLRESPGTVMCASRGCSYGCIYCAPHALDQSIELEFRRNNVLKPPLRLRSTEKVIGEFNEIASLGIKGVEICDNQFFWDKERAHKICQAIKPLKLKWICYSRADYLHDTDTLELMKQAGCKLIYIGTESFNQEILNYINKQCKVSDYFTAVKAVKEAGIDAEVSVLLGASALETEQTVLDSIRQARRLKTRFVHYSIALPLPNTSLYAIAKEKGWMKSAEFNPIDNVREGIMDLPYIKADTLKKIIKSCYLRQYLSPEFIFREITGIRSFEGFKHKLASFFRFMKYLKGKN